VVGLSAAPMIAGYATAKHAHGEVARAMLFLASSDSSFVTGTTLAVDGGMSS
jgi:NAD(P)-dependent dehydrogenase (short-subunit alcohol dehydrogenase family)